eukprot:m.172247 g.172247  ORF g.172247 m.172247 type:complete len:388 (+) comp14574_c0_seq1:550-1713(+)
MSESSSRPSTAGSRRILVRPKSRGGAGMIQRTDTPNGRRNGRRRPQQAAGIEPSVEGTKEAWADPVDATATGIEEVSLGEGTRVQAAVSSEFAERMKAAGMDLEVDPDELRWSAVDMAPQEESATPAEGLIQSTPSDIPEFVFTPASKGTTAYCRITRDKSTLENPMFYLHLEVVTPEGAKLIHLLSARKLVKSKTSYYTIVTDHSMLSSDQHTAKLRANFVGTSYTVMSSGAKPGTGAPQHELREELAAVTYEKNPFGLRGPRQMCVLVPALNEAGDRLAVQPQTQEDGLIKRHKMGLTQNLVELRNKKPQWIKETGAYVLNFHGRVTEPSVKNFQLVSETDPEYIVLQFGRVDKHEFTMDFRYPMSAVQAFGICLSSFDNKIAVE